MKRITFILLACIACMSNIFAQDATEIRRWTLSSLPAADEALITADIATSGSNWIKDSKKRYCYKAAMNNEAVIVGGTELSVTKGLKFTIVANSNGNIRYGGESKSLWIGDACSIIIPDCKEGDLVVAEYMTSKNTATREIIATNLETQLPSTTGKTHTSGSAVVSKDGDVVLTIPGGIYFYSIVTGDKTAIENESGSGEGGSTSPENPDNPKDVTHNFDITQDFSKLHTNIYGNGPKIYVSPTGLDTNDGLSPETPLLSIQKAVDLAVDPGTTIYLAPGEYRPTARINIDNRNGTHDNYNAMVCLDGRAVINCDHPQHGHSDNPYQGIRLTSSYWYFYHIDITNASDNGMLIERNKPTGGSASDIINATDQGHDNIIEACNFYENGDTGLQMKNMAEYNYVINCDSYLNCDEKEGDADGFAPKITVGTGNYFFGCRAWLNSDDGWDVFYKKTDGFGDNQTIIMENCISYKNGFLDETTVAPNGNGNGFKCGSDQGAMNVYLNRCLAVCNKLKGFDQNHNSGDIILNNCTGITFVEELGSSYGAKSYSYRIFEPIASGHKVSLTNCIAINDNDEKDKRDKNTGLPKSGEEGKYGQYGRFEIGGEKCTGELNIITCEFQKAAPQLFVNIDNHAELTAARDANDNIPQTTFAHINPDAVYNYSYKVDKNTINATAKASDLIDKGTVVNTTEYLGLPVPVLKYNGTAPDLGAYETGETTAVGRISAAHISTGKISVNQTASGMVLVTVNGASLSDSHKIIVSDINGAELASYDMIGSTTAISLPQAKGIIVLGVKGSVANETIKLMMK